MAAMPSGTGAVFRERDRWNFSRSGRALEFLPPWSLPEGGYRVAPGTFGPPLGVGPGGGTHQAGERSFVERSFDRSPEHAFDEHAFDCTVQPLRPSTLDCRKCQ
jgi:hypothetical protein